MIPIPIYLGFDRVETIAFAVAAHSISRRSSIPVSIIPLNRKNLKSDYWRPRGELDSTDFSNSRWLVPYLQDYKGWAIFCDSDVLFLDDVAELWKQRDNRFSVMVKKHNHVPKENIKFLGQKQTKYEKKNWSSLMLFNCKECRPLSRHIVNTMTPGIWFHRFDWLPEEDVGEIKDSWNLLVGYDKPIPSPKMVHFTSGGPWHGIRGDYSEQWYDEFTDMMEGDNPIKWHEAQAGSTV